MAAKDMAARGEKTRAKVLKALGKTPKSAATVSDVVGISPGLARKILNAHVAEGFAVASKNGNGTLYAKVPTPAIPAAEVGK